MNALSQNNQSVEAGYVSTGHLPPDEQIAALIAEAHNQFKANTAGHNSQVYPALARCRAIYSASAWWEPVAACMRLETQTTSSRS